MVNTVAEPKPVEGKTVTIRVLIADDHSLVRQGLRRYLDMAEDIDVVGEASNGEEAVAMVEKEQPDIVLLDIRMPGVDGLEAARMIRERFPNVGAIMLTAYDDRQFVVAAPQNKWFRRRKFALADLIDEPWILPPAGSVIGASIIEVFHLNGLEPPRKHVVTFSIPLCHQLLAGHGEDPPRAHLREARRVGPHCGRGRGAPSPAHRVRPARHVRPRFAVR